MPIASLDSDAKHSCSIVTRGVFLDDGSWHPIPYVDAHRAELVFRHKDLGLLRDRGLITHERISLLLLTLVGIFVGGAVTIAVSRWIASLLFGVQPYDGATIAIIALLLAGVACFARYVPARRAADIDLAEALRSE